MPVIATPMTSAAPTRFRMTKARASERRLKAIHNATTDAAMAIAIDAAYSQGSQRIGGDIGIAAMPV
jgi:hypothetical protein